MSAVVHRCRFAAYKPHAIQAIAVQDPVDVTGMRVVVVRASADVEVWNVANDWHMERRIPGGADLSIEAVAWRGNFIYTAGLTAQISQWDASTLQLVHAVDSFGGPVWALAVSPDGSVLAAGCEDGTVKLFSLGDESDQRLQYLRAFDQHAGRILCLDWHASGAVLVSGDAAGTAHVWTVKTGRSRLAIRVATPADASTIVWAVRFLEDMTLATGDSLGRIQLWDGRTGALLQGLATHDADVLTLVVDAHGTGVFGSGVDHKIVHIQQVAVDLAATDGDAPRRKWVLAGKRRDHTHDVRALALLPSLDASTPPLLVSGGVDCNLIVYVAQAFGQHGSCHRKIPPFSHRSLVQLAPLADIVMFENDAALELWYTPKHQVVDPVEELTKQFANGHQLDVAREPKLLLAIKPHVPLNLFCSAISTNAEYVAYATALGLRVLRLTVVPGAASVASRVLLPPDHVCSPVVAAVFLQLGSRLVVLRSDGLLQVIDCDAQAYVGEAPLPADAPRAASYAAPLLAVSSDGQWAARAVDGFVHIVHLDSLTYHGVVDGIGAPTAMAFRPRTPELALVGVYKTVIAMYNVEDKNFTAWSQENSGKLPLQWLQRKQKVIHIGFDPENSARMLLQDHACFAVVHLNRPLTDPTGDIFPGGAAGAVIRARKRKTADAGESKPAPNLCAVKKFKPLLFADFLGGHNIIAVERPWLQVMAAFPPALYRSRYGM